MNFTIMPETERQMVSYLRNFNCCSNCCLRLTGIRAVEFARNNLYDTDEVDTDDKPCFACLGILQHDIQEKTLKQIIDTMESNKYDCPTFTCALSIPICLKLRERYLQISLAQKFDLTENQLYNLKSRVQNIKEIWKIQVVSKVETAIMKQIMSGSISSLFTIDITYSYANDENECRKFHENCATNIKSSDKKHRNNIHSRNHIEKLLNSIEDEEFMKYFDITLLGSSLYVTIGKINCFHGSIFIGGRYSKLSRCLSQTPWYINGEKKMETSVQDLLCNYIMEYTGADSLKFLSSGREDVDVRTINKGRPFAVELLNPKITMISPEKFVEIVDEINTSTNLVKITSTLKILSGTDLIKLKEGENAKTKSYRALCILRNKSRDNIDLKQLNSIRNMEIIQKTPIRVLHRRPLTPRVRVLHEMRARWLTIEEIENIQLTFDEFTSDNCYMNQLFIFDVRTQAGTYVKEFVHGDFGRTRPNLCDILDAEIDIVALDVTDIDIDWP